MNPRIFHPRAHEIRAVTRLIASMTLAAVLLVPAGCKRRDAAPAPVPLAVTVAKPLQQQVLEWDEFIGRLEAAETVEVRARVSGLIESQHFKDGLIIQKGDLLFVIDPRRYRAELEKAEADVARAETDVRRARGELERAERAGPGAISAEELENRRIALQSAEATLKGAKADRDAAALNVEFTEVRAAIGGRIGRALVTSGNLITGGAGQATLLTTITSIDPIYCYVDADEETVQKYTRLATEGKRISARRQAIPAYGALASEATFRHKGYIDFVDNRLDPGTGTLRARAVLSNADESLIPGFFARLRIPGSAHYTATLVPDACIGTDQARKSVFVVGPDNVARQHIIETGALFGPMRAVTSGLSSDDKVIIKGMLRVRDKTPVNPTIEVLQPIDLPDEALPATLPSTLPATQSTAGM